MRLLGDLGGFPNQLIVTPDLVIERQLGNAFECRVRDCWRAVVPVFKDVGTVQTTRISQTEWRHVRRIGRGKIQRLVRKEHKRGWLVLLMVRVRDIR